MNALRDIAATADQLTTGSIVDNANSGGIGASGHADGAFAFGAPIAAPVSAQVGDDAALNAGRNVTVTADQDLIQLSIDNTATSNGLYAHPTSSVTIDVDAPAAVVVGAGGQITAGQNTLLAAGYGSVDLFAAATTHKTGAGAQDPLSTIQMLSGPLPGQGIGAGMEASVAVAAGASITTHGLEVDATGGAPTVTAIADEGKTPQPGATFEDIAPARDIAFNGAVTLTAGPAPELVVDRLGRIVDAIGASATVSGSTIVVNPILNVSPGWVHFGGRPGFSTLGPINPSVITGSQASFTFEETARTVDIVNSSSKNLEVQAIDPIVSKPSATVSIKADETANFTFAVANSFPGTAISIANNGSGGALEIAGDIEDPIGAVALSSVGAILSAGSAEMVRAAAVTLVAGGSVGTIANHLAVDLVDSPQASIAFDALAGGDLNLTVRARLRDPSVPVFLPTLGQLQAGGAINLTLDAALADLTAVGPTYGVAVTTTSPSLGNTGTTVVDNEWPNDNGAPPPLPMGLFGIGSEALTGPTNYSIGELVAGGNITISGGAGIGVSANTVQTHATSDINIATGGNVSLTALSGDLRVGAIAAQNVGLTANAGSILDASTGSSLPAPAIQAKTIALTATNGSIGTLHNALDIELTGAGGGVTALARQGVDLMAVGGDLRIGSVDAGGAIILATAHGNITVAAGATAPEVVGQTITLNAEGGIATAANPLKVHVTASHGLQFASTGAAYVQQVADTTLQEAGLGWSLGDGGTTAGKVKWGTQI